MIDYPSPPTHDGAFRLPGKPLSDSPFVTLGWETPALQLAVCCIVWCWMLTILGDKSQGKVGKVLQLCPAASLHLRVSEAIAPQQKVMHFLSLFSGIVIFTWAQILLKVTGYLVVYPAPSWPQVFMCKEGQPTPCWVSPAPISVRPIYCIKQSKSTSWALLLNYFFSRGHIG